MSVFGSDQPLVTESQPLNKSCWTPMRRGLLSWFQKNAESLAPAYEGAVELLGKTTFPGRIHFIAHAVRDISDRLIFALEPQRKGNRVQYEEHLDKIQEKWKYPDNLYLSEMSTTEIQTVSIPIQVAKHIDKLIKEHKERRQRPNQYKILFQFLMRNDPLKAEVNDRTVKAFERTRSWFMGFTHLRKEASPIVDEEELDRQFGAFERAIYSFIGSFFVGIRELDEILKQANQ